MTRTTKKSSGWSAVRRQLTSWDKPALLALVKDLYEADAGNRDFIQARCQTGESRGDVLEKHRGNFPARGNGKLKLSEARKAIPRLQEGHGQHPRHSRTAHDLRGERCGIHPGVWRH